MIVPAYILADSGSTITNIIFIGVFVFIWLVAWIVSTIAKKQEEERRRRVREQIQRGVTGTAAAPRRAALPQMPMPRPVPVRPGLTPMRVLEPPQARRRFAPQHAAPQRPRPVPQVAEQAILHPTAAAPTVAAATVKRPVAATASAASIHTWLRPATMKQQFILTEVLQPPVALRESHLF